MALEAKVLFIPKRDWEWFLVDGEGTDVESVCLEVSESQSLGKQWMSNVRATLER